MSLLILLLDFAGSVALLLWGTHMVQTGVQRAYGPRLRTLLGEALRRRDRAFLAGACVTALLQSSTATGLMTTGLANRGVVALVPALAVMLGANVGSTLIVQVFSFDVAVLAPASILVGVALFRRGAGSRAHDLGRVFIGLGLMLMALHQLLGLMARYEDAPALRDALGTLSSVPLLDVALAALVTWAVHSSVAVVLLVMSLAAQGVVAPEAALALVLGANIGTAINPVIEGAAGADPAGRRVPVGNLLPRIAGALLVLPALPLLAHGLAPWQADPARAVADFHTAFNLALAALLLPVLVPYAGLLRRLLPDRPAADDPGRPLYLDPAACQVPVVALGNAAREALRMADVLERMLIAVRPVLTREGRHDADAIERQDDVLDRLNAAIKSYLVGLDADELGAADHRRLNEILRFTTHLEQAGDVVDRSLRGHVAKRLREGTAFSSEGRDELLTLFDRLIPNLRMAAALFTTEDARGADALRAERAAFERAEREASDSHFERLRSGRADTLQSSALHLDVLRDLAQISALIAEAPAPPERAPPSDPDPTPPVPASTDGPPTR